MPVSGGDGVVDTCELKLKIRCRPCVGSSQGLVVVSCWSDLFGQILLLMFSEDLWRGGYWSR